MLLKLFFLVLVPILVHQNTAIPIDIADYWKPVDTIAADIKLGFGQIQYETNLIVSNMSSRFKRGPPIMVREECAVTLNQLQQLGMVINNALNNASNNDPRVTCEFDFKSNQHNCGEIIKFLQCGIQHMESGISNNSHSLTESMKWKNAYNELEESSTKLIDNLNQTLSQENIRELDKLKKQIHELHVRISDLTERLSNAVQPIVYRIHTLQYDEAWKEIDRMKNDENLLRNVIATAYYDRTYNSDLRNISDNIAQFIYRTTSKKSLEITLNEFAKIIKDTGENHVTAYEHIQEHMIQKIIKARDSVSLEEYHQMLKDYSTIYFKVFAEHIIKSDFWSWRFLYLEYLRHQLSPWKFQMSGEIVDFVKIAYRYSGMNGTYKIVRVLKDSMESLVFAEGIIALIEEVKKDQNDEKPEFSAFILKAICYLEYNGTLNSPDLEKYFSSGDLKYVIKSFRQLIAHKRDTCKDYIFDKDIREITDFEDLF